MSDLLSSLDSIPFSSAPLKFGNRDHAELDKLAILAGHSFDSILIKHGWTKDGQHFRRPGVTDHVGGSLLNASDGTPIFHCLSTNAPPLEAGRNYTLFRLFAMLEHRGDFKSARRAIQPTKLTFDVLTSKQLDSGNYAVEYLVDDMLVAGQPAICGGVSKTLKTSICIDASIALASGAKFLGRFPVLRESRVLIMSGESGLGTLQETARRICKARGKSLRALDDLLWSEELPQCDSDIDLIRLSRTVRENKVDVLFIDPAYLCLGGDDHADVFKQGQLLRRINKICADDGVTLILIHHNKKGAAKSKAPPQLEDLSMAGFAEFARQWWLIGRREQFSPAEPHQLWLNVGGSAGHSGLYQLDINEGSRQDEGGRRWEVELADHYAAKDRQSDADIRAVRELLKKHKGGLTENAIVRQTQLPRRRVQTALQSSEFVACEVPHPQSKSKTISGYKAS